MIPDYKIVCSQPSRTHIQISKFPLFNINREKKIEITVTDIMLPALKEENNSLFSDFVLISKRTLKMSSNKNSLEASFNVDISTKFVPHDSRLPNDCTNDAKSHLATIS